MSGEMIRLGDKTSHGGTVIEGDMTTIVEGKPVACVGHKVVCPQCKGTFPIVEGAFNTSFFGKSVALAGMKTACGAVLIASQMVSIVVQGGGSGRASASGASGQTSEHSSKAETPSASNNSANQDSSADNSASEEIIEQYFELLDQDGNPVPGYTYSLYRDGELHVSSAILSDGRTQAIAGDGEVHFATVHINDFASRA